MRKIIHQGGQLASSAVFKCPLLQEAQTSLLANEIDSQKLAFEGFWGFVVVVFAFGVLFFSLFFVLIGSSLVWLRFTPVFARNESFLVVIERGM